MTQKRKQEGNKRAGLAFAFVCALACALVVLEVSHAIAQDGAQDTAQGGAQNTQDTQATQNTKAVEQALRRAEEQHKEQTQVVAAKRAEVSVLEQEMEALRGEAVSAEHERRTLEQQENSLRVALAVSAVESERLALAAAAERKRGSAALSQLVFLAGRRPEAAAWHWDNPHQAARAVRLVGLIAGDSAGAAHRLEQNALRVASLALRRRAEQEALSDTQAQQEISAARLAEALARRAVLVQEAQGGLRAAEANVLAAGVKARDLRELLAALVREAEEQERKEQERKQREQEQRVKEQRAKEQKEKEQREKEQAERNAAGKAEKEAAQTESAQTESAQTESAQTESVKFEAPVPDKKGRASPAALASVAPSVASTVEPAQEATSRLQARTRKQSVQQGVWGSPVYAAPAVAFGEGDGIYGEGLIYETEAGEVVAAPLGGKVVWASPFRGWGMLIIVEHNPAQGASFHSLLAGASQADVVVGQRVLAGEPLAHYSGAGSLYWELRVDGKPRDPSRYLGQAVAAR